MDGGSTPDVTLRGVTKRFDDLVAVDDVDLDVRPGEFLALLGPSGCGKTTTLRMIAGFEEPTAGEIEIGGRSAVGVPPHRREVNTVFQQYALFPHMTVLDNVAYGLKQRKIGREDAAPHGGRGARARAADRARAGQAGAALGRHAAARRARPRARHAARRCCCSTSRSARWT